jgi:exopolyphosphatase/pppGpp-phosphohydrolase
MEPHAASAGPTPAALEAEAGIRHVYRAVRAQVGPTETLTVLHIAAGHTAVAAGQGAEAAVTWVLPIGALKTAQRFFRRSPPTPLELENAIATVEDEVMRLPALLPPRSTLWSVDPVVRDIALMAGVAPGACMVLPLDRMEQTFERLAAVAEGRPVMLEGLPESTEFAAALLILREFMHHLGFSALHVRA